MDKARINRIVEAMEEGARKHWPAMFNTPQYKRVKETLAKSEEELTYADKEELGYTMRILCQLVKVDYYAMVVATR